MLVRRELGPEAHNIFDWACRSHTFRTCTASPRTPSNLSRVLVPFSLPIVCGVVLMQICRLKLGSRRYLWYHSGGLLPTAPLLSSLRCWYTGIRARHSLRRANPRHDVIEQTREVAQILSHGVSSRVIVELESHQRRPRRVIINSAGSPGSTVFALPQAGHRMPNRWHFGLLGHIAHDEERTFRDVKAEAP